MSTDYNYYIASALGIALYLLCTANVSLMGDKRSHWRQAKATARLWWHLRGHVHQSPSDAARGSAHSKLPACLDAHCPSVIYAAHLTAHRIKHINYVVLIFLRPNGFGGSTHSHQVYLARLHVNYSRVDLNNLLSAHRTLLQVCILIRFISSVCQSIWQCHSASK